MKTVVLTGYGDVDKLEVREVPEPKPGPNEIKVRMAGASINPIDLKIRKGAVKDWMPLELPTILGSDVSGQVVEVGPGVTAFKIGARVMGLVKHGYAEFVVGPVEAWAEVPAKIDLVDAAALPVVLNTGGQLIDEAVQAREGQLVLVTGAAGSVGRVAVFVAKSRGARVLAGVRARQKAEAAKLGADGVVALDDDAEISKLPQLDAIADTVGGPTTGKLLGKVKPGGTIGSVVGEPPGAKERGLVVRPMVSHPDPKLMARLAQAVADGKLVIPIAKKLPLSQAREAHKLAESGIGGKVILTA
jgi:NADPH:quinone reductase-like Zn-dependent oxidoreductase